MITVTLSFPIATHSTLSCVWIRTTDPKQPLACVWIDHAQTGRAGSTSLGNKDSGAEAHRLCA